MDISIIITVYNGERYLGELIDSICEVEKLTYEIVIVDDGSTDKSKVVIEQYQKKNDCIHYYYKENGGVVSARNYGLSKATGKLLLFCDQDDKIEAQNIETIGQKMIASGAQISFFTTNRLNDSGNTSKCDTVYQDKQLHDVEVADILLRKLITREDKGEPVISYVGHLWAAVFNREFVTQHQISFRAYMSIEDDLLFVLDALDHATLVNTSTLTGYYWRNNRASLTFSGRYIEDYISKLMTYYKYRTETLEKHNICSKDEMEYYLTGMRQEQLINIYNNECLPTNKNWRKSYKEIKKLLLSENYQKAIHEQPACPYARRSTVEMKLMAKGHYYLLMIYKRLQARKRLMVKQFLKK